MPYFIGAAVIIAIITTIAIIKSRKKREEMEEVASSRKWYTVELSGVTDTNEDGTPRQQVLEQCEPGEELVLNEGATRISRKSGEQIGYIERDFGGNLQRALDDEHQEAIARLKEVKKDEEGINHCTVEIGFRKTAPS